LARHASDEVTEAMDRVVEAVGHADNAFVVAAVRRRLKDAEW
jgi:hypothetical protein